MIYVKCDVVDESVLHLLKFMCTLNIRKLTADTLHDFYILKFAFICGKESDGETPKLFRAKNMLVVPNYLRHENPA